MIFFLKPNGTLEEIPEENVNQGSINANVFYLIAPSQPPTSIITVCFERPDGYISAEYPMNLLTSLIEIGGKVYRAWNWYAPAFVSAVAGVVRVQFKITVGTQVTASMSTTFLVNKGVPSVNTTPAPSQWQELLSLITNLQSQITNLKLYTPTWQSEKTYQTGDLIYYTHNSETHLYKSLEDDNITPIFVNDELQDEYWAVDESIEGEYAYVFKRITVDGVTSDYASLRKVTALGSADEHIVKTDDDGKIYAQGGAFSGAVTVPTPTEDSQVATKKVC